MQDLKITLVQANQVWEDKKENYTNYSSLLKSVETDLIVLPEMFNTAFSMNVDELAEDWQDSSSIKWLKDLSKAKNAAVPLFSSADFPDKAHRDAPPIIVFCGAAVAP